MLTPKPLKQLLDQADALIKSAQPTSAIKVASTQVDEVSALASLLAGADTSVTLNSDTTVCTDEMDKIAESINRLQAAAELEEILKLAVFEKKASDEGFTQDQIIEAISKIGAAKLKKNLPFLTTAGLFVGAEEDLNELPVKQKLVVAPRKDLNESRGC